MDRASLHGSSGAIIRKSILLNVKKSFMDFMQRKKILDLDLSEVSLAAV